MRRRVITGKDRPEMIISKLVGQSLNISHPWSQQQGTCSATPDRFPFAIRSGADRLTFHERSRHDLASDKHLVSWPIGARQCLLMSRVGWSDDTGQYFAMGWQRRASCAEIPGGMVIFVRTGNGMWRIGRRLLQCGRMERLLLKCGLL
jgi:hypothetical protein